MALLDSEGSNVDKAGSSGTTAGEAGGPHESFDSPGGNKPHRLLRGSGAAPVLGTIGTGTLEPVYPMNFYGRWTQSDAGRLRTLGFIRTHQRL